VTPSVAAIKLVRVSVRVMLLGEMLDEVVMVVVIASAKHLQELCEVHVGISFLFSQVHLK